MSLRKAIKLSSLMPFFGHSPQASAERLFYYPVLVLLRVLTVAGLMASAATFADPKRDCARALAKDLNDPIFSPLSPYNHEYEWARGHSFQTSEVNVKIVDRVRDNKILNTYSGQVYSILFMTLRRFHETHPKVISGETRLFLVRNLPKFGSEHEPIGFRDTQGNLYLNVTTILNDLGSFHVHGANSDEARSNTIALCLASLLTQTSHVVSISTPVAVLAPRLSTSQQAEDLWVETFEFAMPYLRFHGSVLVGRTIFNLDWYLGR
jgi:hypothetical protein